MLDIEAFNHVGIRIRDRSRSISFYESLGFRADGASKLEHRPGFEFTEVRYRRAVSGIDDRTD